MPLSDREQKILSEIESRLRAEDPKFAQTVSTTTVSTQAKRQLRLAIAGFVLGFALLLAFIVRLEFGIAGFALMLASAVYGGNMLKRLSRDVDGEGGDLRQGLQRYLGDQRDE
jgi:hypothetical protein